MSVKVEISEKSDTVKWDYPCILISSNGRIVLFYSENCGVQLNTSGSEDIHHYDDWQMSSFKPFNGSITLSNDTI